MDERVLGDMPSEGSEGSRRFGIYSAYSPDPKMHSISRIRLMFVIAIAVVVAFAVIFPMVQYATRSGRNSQSIPYPEIANISISDDNLLGTKSQNCSTKVLSFGLDCTESPLVTGVSESTTPQEEVVIFNVKAIEEHGIQYEEDTSEIQMDMVETRDEKYDRKGRSRWPVVSTPYPYYSLPKPTPSADERNGIDFPEQTNIFAIPLDMSTDNFSDYQKPRINFTPPPYAFTPFPNFTDSYAQLSPYKIPKNYSNFEDILKFLNNKDETQSDQPTEKSERILNTRTPMMKVSGTYVMPLDRRRPGEIIVSSSENNEEARPFFNGHAYVTDPFLKFRPANPSEINRLIPIKSSLDLGPRFRKPVSFVPSSSVPVDLYTPVSSPNDHSTAGSHTVAIFHPPPTLGNQRPTTPPPRDKPLSVTLDIYPVTVESEQPDVASVSASTPGRVRGRLDPRWRPKSTERPRWRPQVPRRPSTLGGAKSADNHMIVHLNLFPNKRKQYTFPRRGRQESTTPSDQRLALFPGGQFTARTDQETSREELNTEVENMGTTDPTSSTIGGASVFPEYSALTSFEVEEVFTTPETTWNNSDSVQANRTVETRYDEWTSGSGTTDSGNGVHIEYVEENEKEIAEKEISDEPAREQKDVNSSEEDSHSIDLEDNYEESVRLAANESISGMKPIVL